MAKPYIPLNESNVKVVKNFIGMCRMNGLEGNAGPAFNFRDQREDLGSVSFDLYYDFRGITDPCWKITVKLETENRFHDGKASAEGGHYTYVDNYVIRPGKLEFEYRNSRFNEFVF